MRKLYVLFDRVARAVEGPIITFAHDGPAIRMFHDVLGSGQSSPGQHPADYDLLSVGDQDDQGMITPVIPVVVAMGSQWLETRNREAVRAES